MKNCKVFISVLLILSLSLTNLGFVTLAESISDNTRASSSEIVETTIHESEDDELSTFSETNYNEENETISTDSEIDDSEEQIGTESELKESDDDTPATTSEIIEDESNIASPSSIEDTETASDSEISLEENETIASESEISLVVSTKASISTIEEETFGASDIYWYVQYRGAGTEFHIVSGNPGGGSGVIGYGPITTSFSAANLRPWHSHISTILSVSIDGNITLPCDNLDYWFDGFTNCTSFSGFEKMNTNDLTSMKSTFNGCSSVTNLDLSTIDTSNMTSLANLVSNCSALTNLNISSFNTSNVTDMSNMFNGCNHLTTIHVGSDFDTTNLTNSSQMFANCSTSLKGDKSTTWSSSNPNDASYAHLDGGTSNPGYFSKAPLNWYMTRTTSANDTLHIMTAKNSAYVSATNKGSFTSFTSGTSQPWQTYKSKITKVIIEDDVEPHSNSMAFWFHDLDLCTVFTGLDKIDTSAVTSMKNLFGQCANITNLDLSSFNTSEVTNMSNLFDGCAALTTLDVSSFDTRKVTNMSNMFNEVSDLTSLDISSFNTSNVANMAYMFSGCDHLTTIYASSHFVTTSVTNSGQMFENCSTSLKGDMNTTWSSSNPDDASYAHLDGGTANPGYFSNPPIYWYLTDNSSANDTLHIIPSKNADYNSATNKGPFTYFASSAAVAWNAYNASITRVIIEDAIMPHHNNMSYWFSNLSNLTTITNINNIDTSNVATMSYLFDNCSSLTSIDISTFDTSNVVSMNNMFSNCTNLSTITLGSFDTSSLTNANNMFNGCSSLTTINVNNNIRSIGATGISSTNMFSGCTSLLGGAAYPYNSNHLDREFARVDYGGLLPGYFTYNGTTPMDYTSININFPNIWGTNLPFARANVTNIAFTDAAAFPTFTSDFILYTDAGVNYYAYTNGTDVFFHKKAGINLIAPSDFSSAFSNLSSLETITNLNLLNTSSVTTIFSLFSSNLNLESVDLSSLNLSSVQNTSYVFDGCSALNSVLFPANFGQTSTTMADMFRGCQALQSLDLSNFNTGLVTSMYYMFGNCQNLTSLTLPANFGQAATNMSFMFTHTGFTNLALDDLNTSSATDMSRMFEDCSSLQILSLENSFDTSNVTDTSYMFNGCSNLTTIYATAAFDVSAVTTDDDMFNACSLLKGGQDTTYSDSHKNKEYARIDTAKTAGGVPGYFTSNNIYRAKLNAGTTGGKFPSNNQSTKIEYIEAGDPTNTFEEPIKTGYSFVSWEVAGAALHPNWDYTTNRETEVLATWDPNNYTVNFDLNGGSGTFAPIPATYDTSFDLTGATPTYNGYTFTHWTLQGSTTTYAADARNLLNLTDTPNGSVTLVANYDPNEFNIVFDKNTPLSPDTSATNIVEGTMSPQGVKTNTAFTLKSNTFTLKGYTFIGWATRSCTSIEAENMRNTGSAYIIPDKDTTHTYLRDAGDDITYYALWTRNKYRLYMFQNETNHTIPDPFVNDAEILYDTALSTTNLFDTTGKTRTGYTFTNKWTRTRLTTPYDKKVYNSSATNPYLTGNEIFRDLTDLTIYPLWLNNEVTVSLETFGGTLPDGYTSNTFTAYVDAPYFTKAAPGEPRKADGSLVSPIATLSEIYMFKYWSEDIAGTKVINENTIYTDNTITTIYANYDERQSFTISFLANGGEGNMETISILEGKSYTLPYPTFTKTGYTSNAWQDQDKNIYKLPYTIDNIYKSLVLSAIWTEEKKDDPSGGGGNRGGSGGTGGGGTNTRENTTAIDNIITQNDIRNAIAQDINSYIISMTITSTLDGNDIMLEKNNNLEITGIKVRIDSNLGKTLLANSSFSKTYKTIDNDDNYLRLIDGFYKVKNQDKETFYALDNEGRVLTGFVTSETQKYYSLTDQTIQYERAAPAIYYFYDEPGPYRGALWAAPLVLHGFTFNFDEQGKLKSAEKIPTKTDLSVSSGAWEYNPNTNNWNFYQIDSFGNKNYYKDGLYKIEDKNGEFHYYIFDENGKMKTGLVKHNGNTYYLQESGPNRGAVTIGEVTIHGIDYLFDSNGVMTRSMDKDMKTTNNKRYAK